MPIDDSSGLYYPEGDLLHMGELRDMLKKYLSEETLDTTIRYTHTLLLIQVMVYPNWLYSLTHKFLDIQRENGHMFSLLILLVHIRRALPNVLCTAADCLFCYMHCRLCFLFRRVSRTTHPPGSSEGNDLAREILQSFQKLHMDHTWTDSHYATLQFPSRCVYVCVS